MLPCFRSVLKCLSAHLIFGWFGFPHIPSGYLTHLCVIPLSWWQVICCFWSIQAFGTICQLHYNWRGTICIQIDCSKHICLT